MSDSLSFFREFVLSQDEPYFNPAGLPEKIAGDSATSIKLISQCTIQGGGVSRPSVFQGHFLAPVNSTPVKRSDGGSFFVLSVIMVVFLLAAVIRHVFYKRLVMISRAFAGYRFMNQLVREGNIFSERITLPLFIIFLLDTSLLVWLSVNNFYPGYFTHMYSPPVMIFIIMLIIFAYYIFQVVIVRILGVVLKAQTIASQINLLILIFNLVLGLLLMPFIPVLSYSPNHKFFIAAIIVTGIVVLWRFVRIMHMSINDPKFYKFRLFLFLYLCCVEIIPLLIALKGLTIML